MLSLRFSNQQLDSFRQNWGRFLLWGIALVVLGVIALYTTTVATIVSVVALGFIIFLSGVVLLIDTFTFWWGRWGSFLFHLLAALLYLYVGSVLIANPVEGSISLTLLLGIFYTLIGVFRVFFSYSSRFPRWGWLTFNGVITLVLGILILMSWPASSLYIIGLFVGIDLLFAGLSYLMIALSAR